MKLRISYDPAPEVDVLNIALARRRWVGRSLAANSNFVVQVGENGPQDVVGLLILYASYKVAPHFRGAGETGCRWAGDDQFVRYNPAADLLTWGVAHDYPELISPATGDIAVYWRRDALNPQRIIPVGAALRNAAKHLSPWFEPVETPAAGRVGKEVRDAFDH